MTRRLGAASVAALVLALVFAASASAHARVSPAVSLAGELQLYSLAVPTEKSGATTNKIVLTVPRNFSIDSFVPSPGWHRVLQQTGVGENAVVQKVTWTGGRIPTGEDSLFQFLGQPASPGTYTFEVQQTYSDGSIVDWNGSESSAGPGAHDPGRQLARRRRRRRRLGALDRRGRAGGAGARGERVRARQPRQRGRRTPTGVSARPRIGLGALAAFAALALFAVGARDRVGARVPDQDVADRERRAQFAADRASR